MKNRAFDHSKYQDWIDPNEVKPYERNAKLHPQEQVNQIANSIKRFGWQQDTVITSDNVCVIGQGRRLAAIELGCEMPYHRVGKNADELTDAEIKALRLADNKTAEGGFDFGALEAEVADIPSVDMRSFGFAGGSELYAVSEPEEKENEIDAILETRRIIITYEPDAEDRVRALLGIDDDPLKPVYSYGRIKERQNNGQGV